jgi:hypothetical protein
MSFDCTSLAMANVAFRNYYCSYKVLRYVYKVVVGGVDLVRSFA